MDNEAINKIVEAINGLAPDDPANWTGDGKPNTGALSLALKDNVSAKDRDAAWEIILKQRDQDAKATSDPEAADQHTPESETGTTEESTDSDDNDPPAAGSSAGSGIYEVTSPFMFRRKRREIGARLTLTRAEASELKYIRPAGRKR